jgi:aquaporin Z
MTAQPAGWRDYTIEAALLACFMISASAFTILVEHPRGWLSDAVTGALARRFVIGCAMAVTAIVLIYSRYGVRTGAHMNPAVTLVMAQLRPMRRRDLLGYVAGQFTGGVAGMAVAALLFGSSLSHASINWVVTKPGPRGSVIAFAAECAMTLLMMSLVLWLSNHPRWAPRTGIASAVLLAAFITFEAPLSGMSLNPARTLGPALFAGDFTGLWIYFLAPPAGMTLAALAFSRHCPGGRCPHGLHGAPQ